MKKLLFSLMLLFPLAGILAQSPINKGQAQFNAGVGLSSWGVPVYLGFDYGAGRDVTVGGELSFRSYNEKYSGNTYKHSVIGISANANYHFNRVFSIPQNWDFYAGLNLGFYNWNSDKNYSGTGTSGLGLGGQIGGRYYLSDKLGLNLEFGGGNSFSGGKFGISLRL